MGNRNSKFSSQHSVASTSSGAPSNSNNKVENNGRRSLQVNNINLNNNKKGDLKSQQIYDTLNVNKKNAGQRKTSKKELKHQLLGDINFDDTSTETESLINGFDDMRIHHNQRPSSSNHQRMHSDQNNLRSQFGSFSKFICDEAFLSLSTSKYLI